MIFGILLALLRWEYLASVAVLWFVYKVSLWYLNPLRPIPGPKGSLLFGNTNEDSAPNDAQQTFLNWRKEYGDIFKTWSIIGGYTVHLSNPEYLRRILVKDSTTFERPDFLRKLIGEAFSFGGRNLFNSNGKSHALQRKVLNPAFSYASVQKFIHLFQSKAEELTQRWNDKLSENKDQAVELKIQKEFTNLTLDIIGESAFDYKFNTVAGLSSEESQATDRLLRCAFDFRSRALEILFPFLQMLPSKSREERLKTTAVFRKTIYNVIEIRRKELENPDIPKKNDLLQLFIDMSGGEGVDFTDEDLFAQIQMIMVAGHETTSIALTWTILLLSKYPHVQKKAHDEVMEVMQDDEEFSLDKLNKLKYLDNCIKESMRMYPPALHFGRRPKQDVEIGSYKIPKGTTLMLHIGLGQRDERFWEEPDTFNPDRFDKSYSGDDQTNFQYQFLPFSRGPRMCIGYRFAEIEMKVVLAKLLRSFKFRLGQNQTSDFSAQRVLTLRPNPAPEVEIVRIDS